MSHYSMTPGQERWLKRRYVDAASQARSCGCPGCDKCNGFVAGCGCDELTAREVLDIRDRVTADGVCPHCNAPLGEVTTRRHPSF